MGSLGPMIIIIIIMALPGLPFWAGPKTENRSSSLNLGPAARPPQMFYKWLQPKDEQAFLLGWLPSMYDSSMNLHHSQDIRIRL